MKIQVRPTVYRGIQMRSRLEAKYAAYLDDLLRPNSWRYEPRAYASSRGQYLPDFEIDNVRKDISKTFVEVKPTVESALAVMERMTIIWASDPRAQLAVACLTDEGWLIWFANPDSRHWMIDIRPPCA